MELSKKQYDKIEPLLPTLHGNVQISHREFLNAVLYVCENGCKWRRLPREFGPWHTIYMRFSRWAKSGVLTRVFQALQEELLIEIDTSALALSLDSTCVKVHPDGTGARKKTARNPSAEHAAD